MSHRAEIYLKVLGATLACVLVLLGAFVWLIDPYGISGAPAIPGLNAEKPSRFDYGGRAVRAYYLAQDEYDVVLLGSSRVMVGLDPDDPAFGSARVFNAGLPGTNMAEVRAVADYVFANQSPRQVILGVDFLMFSTMRDTSGDFEQSAFAGTPNLIVYLRRALSYAAISDAAETLVFNLNGERSEQRADGFVDRRINLADGYNARQAIIRTLQDKFLVDPETYGGFSYDPSRTREVGALAARMCEEDRELLVFVTPIHAWQLEAIYQLGLGLAYERWRRDLVETLEGHSCAALWDFSGFNSVTSEPVPQDGPMQGYFETSHFTPLVGGMVLDRLLSDGEDAPDDFGIQLTGASIAERITELGRNRERYRQASPDDVGLIADMVEATETERNTRRALAQRQVAE